MKRGNKAIKNRELLKQFGRRVQDARKRLRLSQTELAERLDKTQQIISGYESGSKAIPVSELPMLAQILGVPINYFFGVQTVDEEISANLSYLQPLLREAARQTLDHYKIMQKFAFETALHFEGNGGVVMIINPEVGIDVRSPNQVLEECEEQPKLKKRTLIQIDPDDPIEPMKIFHCTTQE